MSSRLLNFSQNESAKTKSQTSFYMMAGSILYTFIDYDRWLLALLGARTVTRPFLVRKSSVLQVEVSGIHGLFALRVKAEAPSPMSAISKHERSATPTASGHSSTTLVY